jgi:hypothetical protein
MNNELLPISNIVSIFKNSFYNYPQHWLIGTALLIFGFFLYFLYYILGKKKTFLEIGFAFFLIDMFIIIYFLTIEGTVPKSSYASNYLGRRFY